MHEPQYILIVKAHVPTLSAKNFLSQQWFQEIPPAKRKIVQLITKSYISSSYIAIYRL